MAHPLQSLFDDKFALSQLSYPADLGTSPGKQHWISFNIFNNEKSSYQKQDQNIINNVLHSALGGGEIGQLANAKMNNFVREEGGFLEKFIDTIMAPPVSTQVASIALYMPDTISIAQNSNYSAVSITQALKSAGMIQTGLESITGSGDTWQTFKNIIAEVGSQKLAGMTGGAADTLTGAALRSQGMALNPQMELLFTGIDFRTFQFDFLLTPKSQEEAASIQKIIQAFKFYSAPELAGSGRYFIIPSTFDIRFYFQGNENIFIHKLAPSVLTTVVSDLAPQGWVAHTDGAPVQTRLTLQFKETEILTKDKIKEKGY